MKLLGLGAKTGKWSSRYAPDPSHVLLSSADLHYTQKVVP